MLSKRDKDIIGLISNDIPLVKEPFKRLALELGIEKDVFLERIKSYKENGLMRKFSAAINHRKIGFRYNAMAVWNIPDSLIVEAGNLMASFPEVSHCYERRRAPYWKYNLYSMIHGKTKEECLSVIRDIAKKTYCKDYKILFSSHEYKKQAAKYFSGVKDKKE